MNGRTARDGSFSIPNVPPGRYLAIAQSGGRQNDQRIGLTPVAVNGQNIGGLAISLQPEITMSGNITVESAGTPAPTDYSAFRSRRARGDAAALRWRRTGRRRAGRTRRRKRTRRGQRHLLDFESRAREALRPHHGTRSDAGMTTATQWNLKADSPAAPTSPMPAWISSRRERGQPDMIVLTDRSTSLSGTVRDASRTPVPALTVIAFPADQQILEGAVAVDPGGPNGSGTACIACAVCRPATISSTSPTTSSRASGSTRRSSNRFATPRRALAQRGRSEDGDLSGPS